MGKVASGVCMKSSFSNFMECWISSEIMWNFWNIPELLAITLRFHCLFLEVSGLSHLVCKRVVYNHCHLVCTLLFVLTGTSISTLAIKRPIPFLHSHGNGGSGKWPFKGKPAWNLGWKPLYLDWNLWHLIFSKLLFTWLMSQCCECQMAHGVTGLEKKTNTSSISLAVVRLAHGVMSISCWYRTYTMPSWNHFVFFFHWRWGSKRFKQKTDLND